MSDYYQVLGLDRTASSEDIKRAFRKLSLKYHPDKTPKKEHHDLFIQVNRAYEVLGTPNSKAKYDSEITGTFHGPSMSSHRRGSSSFTQSYSFHTTSTSTSTSTSFKPGAGYYGFYQYMHGRKDDEQRKAEEERARFQNELKKEMLERARAEEEMRRHKMEQDRLERVRAEEEMRQRKMARERIEREKNKENYYREKAEAMRKAHRTSTSEESETTYTSHNNTKGSNSSDPIVLDDIAGSEEDSFYSISDESERGRLNRDTHRQSPINTASGHVHSPGKTDYQDFPSPGGPEVPETPKHSSPSTFQPDEIDFNDEQVKFKLNNLLHNPINIRPKQDLYKRRSVSPRRTPVKPATSATRFEEPSKSSRKRFKPNSSNNAFKFDDLEKNLGVDIENVNFSDMFNSLPEDSDSPAGGKSRKISDSATSKSKRPKLYEYYDGSTHVETLHTPINKSYVKGHQITNVENSFIPFDEIPPTPPTTQLNPESSKSEWLEYVGGIEEYRRLFTAYKQRVMMHQVERIKRDEANLSSLDTGSSFDTYSRCLHKDLEVLSVIAESQRVFNNTMNIYKQNCRWMSVAKLFTED